MVLTWCLQKFEIYIVKGGCTLRFGSFSTLWQAERGMCLYCVFCMLYFKVIYKFVCHVLFVELFWLISHVCNNLFAFWVSVNVYLSNLSFVHTFFIYEYIVYLCSFTVLQHNVSRSHG